jgi:hypothetical protein
MQIVLHREPMLSPCLGLFSSPSSFSRNSSLEGLFGRNVSFFVSSSSLALSLASLALL